MLLIPIGFGIFLHIPLRLMPDLKLVYMKKVLY